MSSDQSFGAWLKERRKLVDLTQDALAEQAGCSTDMVRKIEAGTARPSRQLAELLLICLQVSHQEHLPLVTWARTGQPPAPGGPSRTPDDLPDQTGHTDIISGTGLGVENPYKGLLAFQERDALDFFGRELLTARLVSRMSGSEEMSRFLAVVGPSGSGKSSVVRAGLLPALREQKLPGGLQPLVVDLMPGTHPLEEIEAAFLRVAVNPPSSLMEQLREGERGLVRVVKRVLPSDSQIEMLLVIDQFEELFTLTQSEEERKALLQGIFEAVTDPHSRLWVVVTLRADFYDHPLLYIPSSELVGRRTEVVGPLTETELFRAITSPAERVGLTLEADLPASIIADVARQPGALPLMEYTLTELYEQREGRLLTLRAYRESGSVLGALSRRAERLYSNLNGIEQAEARQLFLRLVTLGEDTGTEDTRRRVRRTEIASAVRDEEALGNVLDLYGRYRMLTFDRDRLTGSPTVEVAHEALLRSWPRLREWLDTSREGLLVQRRLLTSASEWQSAGREPSYLASGVRLTQFAALQREDEEGSESALALTAEERAYLTASLQEQERQEAVEQKRQARELSLHRRAANRLRYLVAGLALFLIVAAALAGWALNRSQVAQHNLTESEAVRFAAEANALMQGGGPAELAGLLSVRSIRTRYSPQGDAALEAAARLDYPVRRFVGYTDAVWVLAFSPDGKRLLTSDRDTTRQWDVGSGKELARIPLGANSLAYSPDSKQFIADGEDGTIGIWDTATMTRTGVLKRHTDAVLRALYSPDGRHVLSGSADKTARVWDAATGKQLEVFKVESSLSGALAWSPDGKYVVIGTQDNMAGLWEVESGRQVRSFSTGLAPGAGPEVVVLAFSPDGKILLTGGPQNNLLLWDVQTGTRLRELVGSPGFPWGAIFSPDGKTVVTSAGVWDAETGKALRFFRGQRDQVEGAVNAGFALSPDGKYVATSYFDGTVMLWDLTRHAEPPILDAHGHLWSVAFSADDKAVLTASDDDRTARLWDAASGQELQPHFPGPQGSTVNSAAFSPDGKYVLTGNGRPDGQAHIWDIHTGAEVQVFPVHKLVIQAVYSPDGKRVLTGSFDKTARLWDAATGKLLQTFTGHSGSVNGVAYSPDGKTVLTSGADSTARLWDVQTGAEIRRFTVPTDNPENVEDVAYSPDGKRALTGSGDGTARLWDIETGASLGSFSGPTKAAISAVAFSPDGKSIVAGSADGVAYLWDIADSAASPTWGRELRRFTGHQGSVDAVAFCHDGKYVLTGSADHTARLWRIDYHDTVRYLCSLLTRDLTPEERAQYGIADQGPTCPAH